MSTAVIYQTISHKLRTLKANNFARNLGSMGSAQLAIRISRLLATILLSRLLDPRDYGLAAVVLTVYEFVALFTRNGISAKVVQASAAEVDVVAMTAYRMTLLLCLGLMVFQILIAWPIAQFYHDERIALPIAAMGIIYMATPLSNIQGAFQQRDGRLGRIALAGATQVIVDNILTALFAITGFGLWAIILPKILVAPIWVGIVRYGHSWRPHKIAGHMRFQGWKDIARFSRSVMGVELLTTFQSNVDNLLVGYFLGLHALGIYYFAFNGGLGITLGLINASGVAVYPHLCEVRENLSALAERFYKTRRTISYTILPLIIIQAGLAPFYVPLVFGHKWVDAVPVLTLVCLSAMARPFASLCSQLLKAIGRPEIELRWQLANTILLLIGLLIGAQFGILAVAFAVFIVQTSVLGAFAYLIPKKVLAPTHLPHAAESLAIIESDSEFESLRLEWDHLWLQIPGAIAAQSFSYCKTAWRQNTSAKLHILTIRREGQLVLIWPMIVIKAYGATRLLPLNSGATEYDNVLVEPDERGAELLSRAQRWIVESKVADRFVVPFVAEGSVRSEVMQSTKLYHRQHDLDAPCLSLSNFSNFDTYWKSLKSSLRSGTARRRNRLEESGSVKVDLEVSGPPCEEAINWALDQKADWLRRKRAENEFIERASFRQFLMRLAQGDDQHTSLKVMTLRYNGEIISCKIAMVDPVRVEGLITVFDPKFDKFSPGVLLLVECFKWCVATGRNYDFRIGDEAYKYNWANGSIKRSTYEIALNVRGHISILLDVPILILKRRAASVRRKALLIWDEPHLLIKALRQRPKPQSNSGQLQDEHSA